MITVELPPGKEITGLSLPEKWFCSLCQKFMSRPGSHPGCNRETGARYALSLHGEGYAETIQTVTEVIWNRAGGAL
jgi:hypothetical protein